MDREKREPRFHGLSEAGREVGAAWRCCQRPWWWSRRDDFGDDGRPPAGMVQLWWSWACCSRGTLIGAPDFWLAGLGGGRLGSARPAELPRSNHRRDHKSLARDHLIHP